MSYSGLGDKVWKNVRLSINKYEQALANDYAMFAERQVFTWERAVISVLSDPLDESQWHTVRPLNRKFPYLNTGNQVDTVSSGVNFKATGQGNYSITAWGSIKSPYAAYTNQGKPARKDGKTPQWVGWMDDVFKGTRGFPSMSDVFKLLTLERAGVFR